MTSNKNTVLIVISREPFFKDKDEIYYRLRVGNFQESKDAEAYAKEIQGMTSLPVWVDFVRQEM